MKTEGEGYISVSIHCPPLPFAVSVVTSTDGLIGITVARSPLFGDVLLGLCYYKEWTP